jgi:hypothetical protein
MVVRRQCKGSVVVVVVVVAAAIVVVVEDNYNHGSVHGHYDW